MGQDIALKRRSEEALFKARLEDAVRKANSGAAPVFLGFFSPREQRMASGFFAAEKATSFSFFGGYEGAERVFCAVFPRGQHPSPLDYPICPLTARFRVLDVLSHRDFLGAVLHLGAKKSSVGDILLEKGRAVLFLTEPIGKAVLQELSKVGKVGVRWEKGVEGSLPPSHQTVLQEKMISSLRLDQMIAAAVGISRGKAAELVRAGMVQLDYQLCDRGDKLLCPGDVFSIRGYGRFCFKELLRKTKKEKLVITLEKYI